MFVTHRLCIALYVDIIKLLPSSKDTLLTKSIRRKIRNWLSVSIKLEIISHGIRSVLGIRCSTLTSVEASDNFEKTKSVFASLSIASFPEKRSSKKKLAGYSMATLREINPNVSSSTRMISRCKLHSYLSTCILCAPVDLSLHQALQELLLANVVADHQAK